MGLIAGEKPHAVCIPYPAQGHINPMLNLAKLLHSKGFCITFVNSEFNHNRLLKSRGPSSLAALPNFRFEAIPDGLPPSDADATQDIPSLCDSTMKNCLPHFRRLLTRINNSSSDVPPVTCVVSDGVMTFTLDAAAELNVPEVLFWTTSACGFMCYLHFRHLVDKGLVPLKDMKDVTNGYLDTSIDWIPGLRNIRLIDFPSFVRTTNRDDIMINFGLHETRRASMATAIILNTFDDLEGPVLEAMSSILPPVYSIGPLFLISSQLPETPVKSLGSNLWREDPSCLQWLDGKEPGSVVYVNFGSITIMTDQQLIEFAFGLANSNYDFLWIIRPDLVKGDSAVLPPEFLIKTRDRSMLASWCPQEAVLRHSSVGGFLTHCGWNSTIESMSNGVPMICWPFFAEQQTNCRYLCTEWGIGMEIDNNVKRDEVEGLIRQMMGGEKGMEMKKKALVWKEQAVAAANPGGSSYDNFERLVHEVLIPSK